MVLLNLRHSVGQAVLDIVYLNETTGQLFDGTRQVFVQETIW